jgi:hypothetical protein
MQEEVQMWPQPTAEPIQKYPPVIGPETYKHEAQEKIGIMPEGSAKESQGYALRSAKRQQQQQTRLATQSL